MKLGKFTLGENEGVELWFRTAPPEHPDYLQVRIGVFLHRLECAWDTRLRWADLIRFRSQVASILRDQDGQCSLAFEDGGRLAGELTPHGHIIFLLEIVDAEGPTPHRFKEPSHWSLTAQFACFPVALQRAVDGCDEVFRRAQSASESTPLAPPPTREPGAGAGPPTLRPRHTEVDLLPALDTQDGAVC